MTLIDDDELRGMKMQGLFQGLLGLGGGLLAQGQGNPNGLMQGVGALNQSMDPRRIAAARQAKLAELQMNMQLQEAKRQQQTRDAYRTMVQGGPVSTGGMGGDQVAMQPGLLETANVSPMMRGLLQADPEKFGPLLAQQEFKEPKYEKVGNTLVQVGPKGVKEVYTAPTDPQSPIAKIQADLAAGRITPEQYQLGVSKMGPTQVNMNVGGKAEETAEAKGVGGFYADIYKDTQNQGLSAQSQKARINRAKQLLANIETGTLTPTTATVKGAFRDLMGPEALNALGIKDDTPVADALRSLGTQFTLGFVDQTKGAISNAEMDLFQKASPGLANSTEGNMLILEMAGGITDRQQKVAKLAREYRQKRGRIDEGFMAELEKFHEANPLFTEDLSKRIDSTMAKSAPAAETKVIGGKTYVKRGTMWFEQ